MRHMLFPDPSDDRCTAKPCVSDQSIEFRSLRERVLSRITVTHRRVRSALPDDEDFSTRGDVYLRGISRYFSRMRLRELRQFTIVLRRKFFFERNDVREGNVDGQVALTSHICTLYILCSSHHSRTRRIILQLSQSFIRVLR